MAGKNKGFSESAAKFAGKGDSPTLKIRQIGNSLGVVLPKEMLAQLGAREGDELQAIRTQKGYELTPYDADLDDAMKWIEKGARRYRNTLRALAK